MRYGRLARTRLRLAGVVLVSASLTLGCFSDAGEGPGKQSAPSPGGTAGTQAADGTGDGAGAQPSGKKPEPDPDLVPRTREEALRFAREVIAEPVNWGAGYVRSSSYKGGPGTTSELTRDCVWKRRPLRSSQLVSITRRSEVPARDGDGPLRVAAVVTVYDDVASAKWAMARTLEDTLRCPEQQLNATERVTGLVSLTAPDPGIAADDVVDENGVIHSTKTPGGPYAYSWSQSRYGPVVLSAVAKGSEGHDRDQVNNAGSAGIGHMAAMTEIELGI